MKKTVPLEELQARESYIFTVSHKETIQSKIFQKIFRRWCQDVINIDFAPTSLTNLKFIKKPANIGKKVLENAEKGTNSAVFMEYFRVV